jgi:ABC-type nickel/cobalt efflux system permease component RcnA
LLALGVSGGLLPCPSALVVLLTAIALHRVAFGLLLIVAFSMGLAVVLVGIGLLLVYARAFFIQRVRFGEGLAARWLPVASALAIMAMGLAITLQALPQSL